MAPARPSSRSTCPSGVDADTGAAFAAAVRADATATFIAFKPGLCTGAGLDRAGVVSLHSLGVAIDASDRPGSLLEWAGISRTLPDALRRDRRNVHKGTFGTVTIVGGAEGMAGAPVLAGRAALKTGAGKVQIGFATATRPAVDWSAPELMLRSADAALAGGADVLVVGPGLGVERDAHRLVEAAARMSVPLVLDADALNLVARDVALRALVRGRAAPTLITPHPAEAARLLGVDHARIAADRLAAARTLAQDLGASCVLKGAGSVLAYPDGGFDINAERRPRARDGGQRRRAGRHARRPPRAGTRASRSASLRRVRPRRGRGPSRRRGDGSGRRRRVGARRRGTRAYQRGANGLKPVVESRCSSRQTPRAKV